MPSREQIIQRLTPEYQEETGKTDLDSEEFADWLLKRGVEPPPSPAPRDLLAKLVRRAWKQDIRKDDSTGKPYHKYHAIPAYTTPNGQLRFVYFDIENADRGPMEKSLGRRKEQMVDDGVRISYDADHWNRINPALPGDWPLPGDSGGCPVIVVGPPTGTPQTTRSFAFPWVLTE